MTSSWKEKFSFVDGYTCQPKSAKLDSPTCIKQYISTIDVLHDQLGMLQHPTMQRLSKILSSTKPYCSTRMRTITISTIKPYVVGMELPYFSLSDEDKSLQIST
ncbi:hypothetical protein VNO78_27976 [Psophocarpus tetragonolobus]|uniref:Uncharacterized protein n=1 Tax=Psophocarpus tetragonolobus TaxID=3891 RepID=A0AAN9S102_PSOTE